MRLSQLIDVYQVAEAFTSSPNALEVWSVTDASGASYDQALARLSREIADEDPLLWQGVVAPARALLWKLATAPLPMAWVEDQERLARDVAACCERMAPAASASTQDALKAVASSALACTGEPARAVADALAQAVEESGAALVVFNSGQIAEAGSRWLKANELPGKSLTLSEYMRHNVADQAYFVGPPRFFGPRPVTAPRTEAITFLVPHWIGDQKVPRSRLVGLSHKVFSAAPKTRSVGDPVEDQTKDIENVRWQDQIAPPTPIWRASENRPPGNDEVSARTVVLTGGFEMYLDSEGDTIRSLDLSAPIGERVQQLRVSRVERGTVLLLREGSSESEALYSRALSLMGNQAQSVAASQERWKSALAEKLETLGRPALGRELERRGVRASSRAAAWTSRTLALPQSLLDFEILLEYLGLGQDPFRANALLVRRMRARAVAEVREALEDAISKTDANTLIRTGFVLFDLDAEGEGLAGLFASRVLAVSPETTPVLRREVRRPFKAEVPSWLE